MKQTLRRRYLELRRSLDTARLSEEAANALATFLRDREARRILIYLPFRHELSPLGLRNRLPKARFFLPRVAPFGLTVHPFDAPRERHRYGFEQPGAQAPRVDPASLDAVVVPGIAFDRAGFRLGYGGGYYDRFLPRLPGHILRIGLAPSALIVEALPHDPWDACVDHLASEHGVRAAEGRESG